jgi:hypothetical protein
MQNQQMAIAAAESYFYTHTPQFMSPLNVSQVTIRAAY